MKHGYPRFFYIFCFLILLSGLTIRQSFGQKCDASTPSFTFNLTGHPDSIWTSPNVSRAGLCCGLDPKEKPPLRCIEFNFTLDAGAIGIKFDIASGAVPQGALGYQINCGPYTKIGELLCLNGPGPHRLTFCEPGNNPNTYTIVSIAAPKVSDAIYVSDGCKGTITTTGYDPATIKWTSTPFNATYNTYLSCTTGCPNVVVTAKDGYPPYVDYEVSGKPFGGCATVVKNVVRAYFISDKTATILPQDPVICFGGTAASIKAFGSGGAPPYTYHWNTGETTQSINVGIGTYWVEIKDASSCPTAFDTVVVTAQPSPIRANAGPDLVSCANNPSVTMQGSVEVATGGAWTGGAGTFTPYRNALNAVYTPTAAEITAGSVTFTLTTTGNKTCPAVQDEVILKILPAPVVNAGVDKTVCANNVAVTLVGTVTNATGGTWSGGGGTFSNVNSLTTNYTPSAAEITAGSVTLTLTSTGNGSCLPVADQVKITITPKPTVNAGVDQVVCGNKALVSLAGTVTVATGGTWSGGTGSFSAPNSLTTTYTPSAAEITAGTVTLTLTSSGNGLCNAVADQIKITITPAPTINAGADKIICADQASVSVTGTVTVAMGGTWTSSGSGTFSAANSLTTNYTPSAADITAGTVTLTLTSTGNGSCLPVADQVKITITPKPTVNAGVDQTVCGNKALVSLAGTVTVATGGTWSGGTGSFSAANSLATTYTPSVAEITAGTVTLTLTSTGNGLCNAVTDQVKITITPAPTINAGADKIICADQTSVLVTGTATVATGGTWSGGTGSFSAANSLATNYTPSAADITAGTVTLTLTSTGNGLCNSVNDQVKITITPKPTINAGPDQIICADQTSVSVSGTVTIATGGTWTSSGSGTFSAANSLTTSYTPSAADITAGNVTLTLTSTGNGGCTAVNDQVKITITPKPMINAGADQTVCGNNPAVTLAGSVTMATGAAWTGGTGIFAPNRNTLNATYTPSAAEITAGTATLMLTSTGNGLCNAVNDQIKITVTPAPTINAGPDQIICADQATVSVTGTVTVATGGTWTSSGSGTFSAANSLTTNYTPSTADITVGTVTLTLTSTGNGLCNAVTDQVKITITPKPTIDAGADQTVCANSAVVTVAGSVSVATGGTWTSSGSGVFANANALVTTYTPSSADTTAGTVILTLTTTGTGMCIPISDALTLTIEPAPVVLAGATHIVCADNASVVLNGTIFHATSGEWMGGNGTFTPNRNALNATYTPSAGEITAGTVTLTLVATRGTCNPVTSQTTIIITKPPTANAGPDQISCGNNALVNLNGVVTTATGGVWAAPAGSTGTFSPNATTLNATYLPSAAEILAGSVVLKLTTTGNGGCMAVSDEMTITITPTPTVDAGPDQTVCANNSAINLAGFVSIATGGEWSGGSGVFSPDRFTLLATYQPSAAEILAGSVSLKLTTTGNGTCLPLSDNVTFTITPAPTIDAGPDQTVCADNTTATLTGSVTIASGGTWSGGSGVFSNANGLLTTYTPSAAEITAGSVVLTLTSTGNGTCLAVMDQVKVIITPIPTVNAGADLVVCGATSLVDINGVVTTATGGKWSTNGTGTFADDNALHTSYLPSQADKDNGVTLTLTTTGNAGCIAVQDQMLVTFTAAPSIDAGPDQIIICTTELPVQLNGTGSPAAWSGGAGVFTPDANSLSVKYMPTAAEITAGKFTLTLTTTVNGACLAVKDTIQVIILPGPIVSTAGSTQTVCADVSTVSLLGSVIVAGGGPWETTWTSSGTGTFLDDKDPNTSYTLSPADKLAGTVTVTLTGISNGTCQAVSDKATITITPAPLVDAGSDQTVCANQANVSLNGRITIAGINKAGEWIGGAGTFTPDRTTINAVYTPHATEITAGTVALALKSTDNGTCNPVSDEMVITITPAPVVSAGNNQLVCSDAESTPISGTVTIAGISKAGVWSTSGSGSFTNPTALATTYYFSADDKLKLATGGIMLTLTSDDNGNCISVASTTKVQSTPAAIADAGANQSVCVDVTSVSLAGLVTNATGGSWSAPGGTSGFSDATSLTPTYTFTPADKLAGSVTLTLATTGQDASCAPATDKVTVFFTPGPVADAGSDGTACYSDQVLNLSGKLTNAISGVWSTTGSGTLADANSLNTTYQITDQDRAALEVKFTLKTGLAGCNDVTDEVVFKIAPEIKSDAGADQIVCADVATFQLNGDVTTASGGSWTTSGSGTLSSSIDLGATYTLSDEDKANGKVTFTLTTTGNGTGCTAVSDQMILTITPAPVVNAGLDQSVCANNAVVSLQGQSSPEATAWQWTSSGSGSFSNATALATTYTPSAADTVAKSVTLTLTSTASGTCQAVSDALVLSLTPAPVVVAGSSQTVCADQTSVALSGSVLHAGGGLWKTSGTGSFSPDAHALNAQYVPSAADRAQPFITLTLSSDGTGGCLVVMSSVQLTFTPAPLADAGADQSVCADAGKVSLVGNVTNASGGTWSAPGGLTSGFSTVSGGMNFTTDYTFTAADKVAGQVTLTLTTTGNGLGCGAVSDAVIILFTPAPTVNAGVDQAVCYADNTIQLSGSSSFATSTVWSLVGGSGSFSSPTDAQAIYQLSAADKGDGLVAKKLTFQLRASLVGCNEVLDEMEVTLLPKNGITSPANQVLCADVNSLNLSGSLQGISQAVWSSSGSGSFGNANALNTSYSFSAADKANGGVVLTLTSLDHGSCAAVSATTKVSITPAPVVNAGLDQSVCANNAVVSLQGQSSPEATAWQWTSSGSGSFSNATALATTYTPSAADTVAKSVTLTLTSTANGTCQAVSDALVLSITPAPVVVAGSNQMVCANQASVALSGSVLHAGGGLWKTSGTGSFFPDANSLNTQYLPSAEDRSKGTIVLTLTSSSNGGCTPISSTMTLTLSPVPTADAGPSTICADAAGVQLNGVISVATAAVWSAPAGSTGTFSPNATTLNATYHPSPSEISAGTVTLTLTTTTGNGPCTPAIDQVAVTITPAPTVEAGANQLVCADVTGVSLSGQITVASGAVWSSSGGGIFLPSPTALNATYHLSTVDLLAGKATLTLATTDNGTCNPVTDAMTITITPAPTVNAGAHQTICADDANPISLNGKVTVATGGTWTSSGTGTFPSGADVLKTTYLPSALDKQKGSVTLTLTTTGNGTCNEVTDQMVLLINPAPVVSAGMDAAICGDVTATHYTLGGMVAHASGGHWTTTGSGTFSDPNALKTAYAITDAERLEGKTITFTLTSVGNGLCKEVAHSVKLLINKPPTVDVGPDKQVCANDATVQLLGKITIAAGGTWSTSGTGKFLPTVTSLNASYVPSQADIKAGKVMLTLASNEIGTCTVAYDSLQVTYAPLPLLAGEDKVVCVGGATQISTTNVPGATYVWTLNGVKQIGSTTHTLNVTATKMQTYIVTVTDGNKCSTKDTIVVRTIPPPIVALDNVPACIGDVITLNATPTNLSPIGLPTYAWYKDGVKQPFTTPSIDVITPGTYSVVYTQGECSTYDTARVSFYEHPVAKAQELVKFCQESDVKVAIDAGPGVKYLWEATGHTTRQEEVFAEGSYVVRVYNEFNCFTLDTVKVEDVCPPRLFVPSAFEPNGNGENDTFDVFGDYFKDFEMTIFNRWGEIIFYTNDRYKAWDGYYRGELMPIGVYAWTISYRAQFQDFDTGPQRMKGNVTVVR